MDTVSIKDIAKAANVSHPTVSRALRGSPLVNQTTAERIRRIANELGYQPSAAARSLVTRRSHKIGVVVTTLTDPFIAEVVSVVEEVANENGFSILLTNSKADPSREMSAVQVMHEQRVDGVLVMASRVGALYMPMLSKLNVPVVLIDNQHPEDFVYSVLIDNVTGALDVTRHLISLGHRRIAYIGDRYGFQSEAERFQGYSRALQAAALSVPRDLTVQGDGKVEGGIQAMDAILARPELPTAVFCYNDMTALGALHAIRCRGLSVPSDISVAGFDDISFASYSDPPLTTIRQPKDQMGRAAVGILLDLFSQKRPDASMTVRGELVVRGSTAAPRDKGAAKIGTVPSASHCER